MSIWFAALLVLSFPKVSSEAAYGYVANALSCAESAWAGGHYSFQYRDTRGNKFEPLFGSKEECETAERKLSAENLAKPVCGCESSLDETASALTLGLDSSEKDTLFCYAKDSNGYGKKIKIREYRENAEGNLEDCEEGLKEYLTSLEPQRNNQPLISKRQTVIR